MCRGKRQSAPSLVLIFIVSAMAILFTSCHFIADRDQGITYYGTEINCSKIDQLLESALKAKKDCVACDDWLYTIDDKYFHHQREDWDEIIGELYAIRSICLVNHSPVYIVSGEFISLGIEGGFSHGIMFFLFGIITIPIDVVQLPIQFSIKTVNHISVSKEKLTEALFSLSLARKYGFNNEVHHSGFMMTPRYYYLDQIGYSIE